MFRSYSVQDQVGPICVPLSSYVQPSPLSGHITLQKTTHTWCSGYMPPLHLPSEEVFYTKHINEKISFRSKTSDCCCKLTCLHLYLSISVQKMEAVPTDLTSARETIRLMVAVKTSVTNRHLVRLFWLQPFSTAIRTRPQQATLLFIFNSEQRFYFPT